MLDELGDVRINASWLLVFCPLLLRDVTAMILLIISVFTDIIKLGGIFKVGSLQF